MKATFSHSLVFIKLKAICVEFGIVVADISRSIAFEIKNTVSQQKVLNNT